MRRVLSIVLGLAVSFSVFAQKKELKSVAKLIKSGKFGPANKELKALEASTKGTEFESQVQFLYGKSAFGKNDVKKYPQAAKFFNKVLKIEVETGDGKYSEKASNYLTLINSNYLSSISKALKSKDYNKAGNIYNGYSKIYPERRDLLINMLYSFQQAKNDNKVLEITKKLLNLDKGKMSFNAKNKQTNSVNEFFKKGARDNAVKSKTHSSPEDVVIEDKVRINYYNFLVGIYAKKELNDDALNVLKKAKKEFPTNVKFVEDYSTIVQNKGNKEDYVKALEDVLKLKSTDKNVWMNLGITKQELKDNKGAIAAYDKVIEIDSKHSGAYINKGLVIMSEEKSIIDELNQNLSNKTKHAEISKKLKNMYLGAISSFEKAQEIKPNDGIKSALVNLRKAASQK